jgi:hypothetical protein
MATKGQNYAVGIGTGAAGGAAAGSAFGPWGTAIGAGVGAIGGAVSAGMANSKEADEKRKLAAAQQRSRQNILIDLQRDYAARHGVDTTYLDTLRALKGEGRQEAAQNAAFAAQHRIDPQSFVPIAVAGTQAAGRLYNQANTPVTAAPKPTQFQLTEPMSAPPPAASNYPELQLSAPEDPYMGQRNGYRLPVPDFLRSIY